MQSGSDRFIPWKAQPHLSWKRQAFPGKEPRLMRNRPLIGGRVAQKKIQGWRTPDVIHLAGRITPAPPPPAPWNYNHVQLLEPLPSVSPFSRSFLWEGGLLSS